MKSVIVSGAIKASTKIADAYKKSLLGILIEKSYGKASASWGKSRIVNAFGSEKYADASKESLLSKLIYLPFTIVEFFNKKYSEKLSDVVKNSLILQLGVDFVNGFLALNTRFLGCLLLGMLVSYEVVSRSFSVLSAIISVIGVVLLLLNLNITSFLKESKVIGWCMSLFGLCDVKWDIYEEERLKKKSTVIVAILFGLACGILPLKFGVLAPFAIAAAGSVMIYPVVGVFFAIFAAPFVPTMALAGLCVLTFGALFVKSLIQKDFRWKRDGVGVCLGFFILFMMISSIFSFAPKKSILVWGMYLIFAGFYFVIVNTVKTKQQFFGLLKIFAIAGLFVSLYGVFQYVFGWNVNNAWIDEEMFEEATMRAYSTMENPNVLGEYLLLLIPISAIFFLKKGSGVWERIAYIGIFAVGALCMIFTQSRGCWLGLILAAAIFVTFYNGRLWALFPLALVALIFLLPQAMIDRMLSVGNMEDSSTSYRVFIWLGTFNLLKDFWIGGIGMGEGAFRLVYPLYSYNGIIAPHSHNTFLQLLVEGGIGALLTFVVLMISFLKNMVNVFRKCEKQSAEALSTLAIGSATVGFLLQSMFDYTFYNYRMMAMFFMVIAIGMSLKHIKEEQNV